VSSVVGDRSAVGTLTLRHLVEGFATGRLVSGSLLGGMVLRCVLQGGT